MKYEFRLSLQVFMIGTVILSIGYYFSYRYNHMTVIQKEFEHTSSLVDELSVNFEQRLLEKVKTNRTLSITPILKNKLIESNNIYGIYSDNERDEIINSKNNKWKAITNDKDAFILEFTDNEVAQFLKEQQKNLSGEYGEIFLTNKYGVIIASTSKLTTLAHAHKYWWKEAYNNGKGTVFFDDRGYDESVGGYVLGTVIPIKDSNEIIGILKVNLNILGSISEMLTNFQNEEIGEFKLIRSGGEIIFDNKNAPLSNRIPNLLYEKIQIGNKEPFIFQDSIDKLMIGMSEIKITSKYAEGFRFGGSFKSIDHVKGNTGESWFIINYRNVDTILKPLKNHTSTILAIGFLLIIILAIAALIIGKLTARPLKQLIEQSKKIAKADFSSQINVTRNDEIGLLGIAFNKMSKELEQNTTSILNLESEVSLRLKAEQKLKKKIEEYVVLNAELIKAKEKAEGSDRLKSAFLSNMSHEIRTPMNGILGFTDLLREPNLSGEERERFINIIRKSGDRMLNTVNDIIDISKIDAGQMELSNDVININEEIKNQFEFFKEEASAKGLVLKLINKLPQQSIIISDKVKLDSIFSNLIKNAIKYTDKGSVEIRCNKKGSEFEFIITDTGIGIPENRIQPIFNRFEQADIDDTHALEGSGLGLSITKAYVEMLNGKIGVESETGLGSTFYFTLPWIEKQEKPERIKEKEVINTASDNQINIIIAEDDDISFEHLSIIIGCVAKNIFRVSNGKDAVELIKKNTNIHLILMDVKMPVMDGYKATKEIRKFNKDVAIIAQTAYALTGDKEKALAAGCNDYITKPINKKLLLKTIYKLIG